MGDRSPLKQRAAHFIYFFFFCKQGEKRAGKKAKAKTTGVVESADGVRRLQGSVEVLKRLLQGHKKKKKEKGSRVNLAAEIGVRRC